MRKSQDALNALPPGRQLCEWSRSVRIERDVESVQDVVSVFHNDAIVIAPEAD